MEPQANRQDNDQGPWLAAALFCDALLEDEKTESRTLVRLLNGGEFFDEQRADAYGRPVMFLSFIGGTRTGRFTLEIFRHLPGRAAERVSRQQFQLDGPGGGFDVYGVTHVPADIEGIAWFDIVLDGRLMTRMAYRVLHIVERGASDDVE